MEIETRVERLESCVYCAYCGKELSNSVYRLDPPRQLVCNCDKAKEELSLYERLRQLYSEPLADNLIEMKVNAYRYKLQHGSDHVNMHSVRQSYSLSTDELNSMTLATGTIVSAN